MGEPAIFLRAMPMLDFGQNGNDRTGSQWHRSFPRLLIPPLTGGADQQLAAAFFRVVDMPVIPALNWTPPPQSLVVAGFNGIHICALCESFLTSNFYQVIFLFLPRSKPLLQG